MGKINLIPEANSIIIYSYFRREREREREKILDLSSAVVLVCSVELSI